MKTSDLKVDGNAVAGLLREVFAFEMTSATGTCGNCGGVAQVGAAYAYVEAPGAVLRCPICDFVLLRVVRSEERLWFEMRGVRSLELKAEAA